MSGRDVSSPVIGSRVILALKRTAETLRSLLWYNEADAEHGMRRAERKTAKVMVLVQNEGKYE